MATIIYSMRTKGVNDKIMIGFVTKDFLLLLFLHFRYSNSLKCMVISFEEAWYTLPMYGLDK